MAKIHGSRTRVYFNGFDVSNYFNQADSTHSADVVESSGFGDLDKTFVPGQRGGAIRLAGQFDDRAGTIGTEKRFNDILGASPNPIMTIVREDVKDGVAHGGEAIETSLSIATPIGGVAALNAEAISNQGIDRYRVAVPQSTLGTIGGTLAQYAGGGTTAYGLKGILHVFNVISGTPVYTIEHSSDGASGWATFLTFVGVPAGSAPQSQLVRQSGNVKPYLRTNVSGGTASVWIGVNQPIG